MNTEDMFKTMISELEKMISTDTVVGEPQSFGEITIIPVSSVGFAFGAGAGSGGGEKGPGEGGGGGAGGGVKPVALIVVKKDKVEVVPFKAGKGGLASAIEAFGESVPKMMEKAMEVKKAKKEG